MLQKQHGLSYVVCSTLHYELGYNLIYLFDSPMRVSKIMSQCQNKKNWCNHGKTKRGFRAYPSKYNVNRTTQYIERLLMDSTSFFPYLISPSTSFLPSLLFPLAKGDFGCPRTCNNIFKFAQTWKPKKMKDPQLMVPRSLLSRSNTDGSLSSRSVINLKELQPSVGVFL